MKRSLWLLALSFSLFVQAEKFVIDRIEAVIFGAEETTVVTKSDVDRMSLDGNFRVLDEVIFEQLTFQEAKKFKIKMDENAINRYLENIQRENNLSHNELRAMFSSAGYTYEEGRAQLGIMFAVNSVMDFKIRSRLIVQEKDVVAYYNAHPVYQEASYQFKKTVIPFDPQMDRKQQIKKIEDQIRAGKAVPGARWGPTFWINEAEKVDVAEDKQFIFRMRPGTISRPREVAQGFEMFAMVKARPRRLVPLDDRYREISEALRRPRYEQLLADFKKELFDGSSIIRF